MDAEKFPGKEKLFANTFRAYAKGVPCGAGMTY